MSDAPKRIWLQWDGSADEDEVGEPYPPEVTWCQDRVFDRDVEYVRADEIARLQSGHCKDCCCARSWKALGITTYTGCSIPEEIESIRNRVASLTTVLDAARKAMNSGNPLDDVELRFAIRAYDEGRTG